MTRALVHQNLKGALLLAVLIIASASAGKAQQPPAAPVPAVVVETVAVASAAAPQRFNGQIEAIEAVDIQARITGFLKGKAFEQGARIKAGDLLFEIEPDALQAALTLAQAQLARATANQNATRQTLSRTRTLASRNTASQAALDDAQAAFDIASADVQGAEANLNIARLNLSYTKIRSPINGTIGRSLVTLGNLVGPGSGPLARIVQLDPVRVVFSITDRALVSLRQQEAAGQAINPHQFSLNLVLANGTTYSQRGTLQFIDNEVSAQTGTVAVRALFANPDQILVPGQVVAVQLVDEAIGTLPVVPMSSVLQDRQGKYVFVLGTDNKVSRRPIVTGARIGNRWAVTSGVTQGEQIVTQGLQRLADQQLVAPREAIEDGGADQ